MERQSQVNKFEITPTSLPPRTPDSRNTSSDISMIIYCVSAFVGAACQKTVAYHWVDLGPWLSTDREALTATPGT